MTPCSICIRQAPHSVAPISMSSSRSRLRSPRPARSEVRKLVARQAEGAGHARAAAVDELDVELGDLADQVEPGRADVEGPEVAGLVVADPGVERVLGPGQLAPRVEAGEVLADVHGVLGHERGVEVVGQLEVLLAEHQRGGRLGADDRVAVADGVAQDPEVRQGQVAGVVDVAGDQRRPSPSRAGRVGT